MSVNEPRVKIYLVDKIDPMYISPVIVFTISTIQGYSLGLFSVSRREEALGSRYNLLELYFIPHPSRKAENMR